MIDNNILMKIIQDNNDDFFDIILLKTVNIRETWLY